MKVQRVYSSTTDGAAVHTSSTDAASSPAYTTYPPTPKRNCEVADQPDGSVIITLRVDPDTMKRHRSRAGQMDLSRYMWENILHRALVDSVW